MADPQQGQSALSSSSSDYPAVAVAPYPLPRITIRFCTQCKWMLRAAYFAQELLSTFSTSLGEVALQPSTGGTFIVEIYHATIAAESESAIGSAAENTVLAATGHEVTTTPVPHIQTTILWDRKTDGGFPETKELKRRVRDVIEPGRNLGHVDKDYGKKKENPVNENNNNNTMAGGSSSGDQQQQQQQQQQPVYNPSMAMGGRGRGMMPLAPPPGHKWEVPQEMLDIKKREEEEKERKRKEECEDCK